MKTQPTQLNPILPQYEDKNKNDSYIRKEIRKACARCAHDSFKLLLILGMCLWVR